MVDFMYVCTTSSLQITHMCRDVACTVYGYGPYTIRVVYGYGPYRNPPVCVSFSSSSVRYGTYDGRNYGSVRLYGTCHNQAHK